MASRFRFVPLCMVLLGPLSACSSSEQGDDVPLGDTPSGSASSSGGSGTSGASGSSGADGSSSSGTSAGSTSSSGSSSGATVWTAPVGTSWQWQLSGTLDTSLDVNMFDIDLFDTPTERIDALRSANKRVICYFSAGTREDWRSDANQFDAAAVGADMEDWEGEAWLDVRAQNVRDIMKTRLDLAVQKRCDGVEPDNVDGYQNDSGFPLTSADQLAYNQFLATEAHARGLSVGLKNALELVSALQPHFDWALNEECLAYDECTMLAPFIQAGKAVFHTEYVDSSSEGASKRSEVCGQASIAGFSTLIKTWDLDAWRLTCP